MSKIVSCQVPEDLVERVDAIARSMNYSRNAFLLRMIQIYVEEIEKEDAIITDTAIAQKAIADDPAYKVRHPIRIVDNKPTHCNIHTEEALCMEDGNLLCSKCLNED